MSPMQLGLVAGEGRLPDEVEARFPSCTRLQLRMGGLRLGAVDTVLNAARLTACDHLCFAGGVNRDDFRDLDQGAQWIAAQAGAGAGDSQLLDALVAYAEQSGFRVVGVNTLCADLLTPKRLLCGFTHVSEADQREGLKRARKHGLADLGQAVVRVGDQWLVEGPDGTNALIARAGAAGEGQKVLFKAAKPQQDLRVDLPAWGLETVQAAVEAGFSALVFEAEQTIGLDREEALAAAKAAGLTIIGARA